MKKELVFEELTLDQKLGMLLCANIVAEKDPENLLKMIRERKIGAVYFGRAKREEHAALVNEAADYPILTVSSGEQGGPRYPFPAIRSLGATGYSEELAYTWGKLLAYDLRMTGMNTANTFVVDLSNVNIRHIGDDAEKVARCAVAATRGMHDMGVLSIIKHYPGPGDATIDSHMQEGRNDRSVEELMSYDLLPYFRLMEEGMLDGVMPGHRVTTAIDPNHPSSISKKVMDILRDRGWEGVSMTDALNMMGIVLKYGKEMPTPLSIAAGNDFALPWDVPCDVGHKLLKDGYEKGIFTEEQLNAAVRRVLLAQHKANLFSEITPTLTERDIENYHRIAKDCISGHYAEGVPHAIPKDGRHLFVILYEHATATGVTERNEVPFLNEWFLPHKAEDMIRELFPNSECIFLPEFPAASFNMKFFDKQLGYDSVVYLINHRSQAYIGRDCLSERILSVMRALQSTNRVSAILHFGNPHMLAEVPRCDRVILGYTSIVCVEHALHILRGDYEAVGTVPYRDFEAKV